MTTIQHFNQLGLPDYLLESIQKLGFDTPTPIQAQAIPALLAGSDVLGQAQTGTGKTAAFALPLLAQIQVKRREPQILVLVPTRELAIQVAEAFSSFATNMPELNILPIYGGQGYSTQLNMLRKGVHIVIGTPGRVMDHIRRETLVLDSLKTLILDEADEMLRMGFAEDVEWILEHAPEKRQTGLFSATMPAAIKEIAETHLQDPVRITVKTKTSTASTIRQFFLPVSHMQKIDALSRVLEIEDTDAVIVFVKTKRATEEVAEELTKRGFNAVAINGDIVQQQRERVIEHLKTGRIKILVATDVAARGIDVERITHVINYDAPNNAESYVHRIGRTGRAGRSGTAIIFITPRERFILRNIEHSTKQPIEQLETPSISAINARRVAAFKQRITDALGQNISFFETLINEYITEHNIPAEKIAAALAKTVQGDNPLILKKDAFAFETKNFRDNDSRRGERRSERRDSREFSGERRGRDRDRSERFDRKESREFNGERRGIRSSDRSERDRRTDRNDTTREFSGDRKRPSQRGTSEYGMEQYRVEIGHDDGLLPKNLVGAIANTAGIEGRLIGKIRIESKFSLVDLPAGMPKDILQSLQRLKLSGKQMKLRKV